MLTNVIPAEKRSTAFGLFDTGYEIAWVSEQRSDGFTLRQIDPGCSARFNSASTFSAASTVCGEQEALGF
jgi:hypothetical protein